MSVTNTVSKASVKKSFVILNSGGTGDAEDGDYLATQSNNQIINLRATGFIKGRNRVILIKNTLNVTVTIELKIQNNVGGDYCACDYYSGTVASGASLILQPFTAHASASASVIVVPALAGGHFGDSFSFLADMAQPTEGTLSAEAFWEE